MSELVNVHSIEERNLAALTAVKVSVIVLCNAHIREMLLSLSAAAAACLLLLCAAPLLPLCCSAAQVQLVWLCNH